MINAIIESISISLDAEFGDGYTIYTETVEQGIDRVIDIRKRPCFFISCINPTSRLFFGKRYFRENSFCIQYFPADKGRGKEECNAVAERLFLCLEYLEVDGDLVRGTKMKYETADGVLSFFVNYDMFVYRVADPLPPMGQLEQDISVKG